MHQFEGGACHKGACAGNAIQGCRLNHQKGPQALSAVQRGVPHRCDEPRRPCGLARKRGLIEQPRKQLLGFSGNFREAAHKGIGSLAHRCIDSPLHAFGKVAYFSE